MKNILKKFLLTALLISPTTQVFGENIINQENKENNKSFIKNITSKINFKPAIEKVKTVTEKIKSFTQSNKNLKLAASSALFAYCGLAISYLIKDSAEQIAGTSGLFYTQKYLDSSKSNYEKACKEYKEITQEEFMTQEEFEKWSLIKSLNIFYSLYFNQINFFKIILLLMAADKALEISPEILEKSPDSLKKMNTKIKEMKANIIKLMKNNKKKSLIYLTHNLLWSTALQYNLYKDNCYKAQISNILPLILNGKLIFDLATNKL